MTIMRKSRRGGTTGKVIIAAITILLMALQLIAARRALFRGPSISSIGAEGESSQQQLQQDLHHNDNDKPLFRYFTSKEAEVNADAVQASREALSCEETLSSPLFQAPGDTATSTTEVPRKYAKRCKYTFLDLGANLGDSLGKLIDAGLPVCKDGNEYRYTGCDGLQRTTGARNKLTEWVQATMTRFQRTHGNRHGVPQPERYCYVGIEGNPRFRQELETLQQCVMQAVPRPLRSVHMYTDTVASGEGDGPTVLYLDTVNAKNNFFGSSLLSTHTDVKNSAKHGSPETAAVTGITLSSLLKETVAFGAGSHVMVKIDIEGAEYKLLNEAYNSNVLCECAQHGKTLGGENADLDRFKDTVRYQLKDCGVNVEVVGDAG